MLVLSGTNPFALLALDIHVQGITLFVLFPPKHQLLVPQ